MGLYGLVAHVLWRDARVVDGAFSYNAHIPVFLALADSGQKEDGEEWMRLILLFNYLLAGVSKLTHSGRDWLSGATLAAAWYESETRLGVVLSRRRRLAAIASRATIALEILVLPIYLVFPELRRLIGLLLIGFHLATLVSMKISFWPMSIYLFPLFLGAKDGDVGADGPENSVI